MNESLSLLRSRVSVVWAPRRTNERTRSRSNRTNERGRSAGEACCRYCYCWWWS